MKLGRVHHVAVICSDWERSLAFYVGALGMEVLEDHYRAARDSHKTDLAVGGRYVVELFSFPNPPPRPSYPEAAGLRHLAFEVADLDAALAELDSKHVAHETVRTDEWTGRRFAFLHDPDGLPIELYESSPSVGH